jgi:hypothetical protein
MQLADCISGPSTGRMKEAMIMLWILIYLALQGSEIDILRARFMLAGEGKQGRFMMSSVSPQSA